MLKKSQNLWLENYFDVIISVFQEEKAAKEQKKKEEEEAKKKAKEEQKKAEEEAKKGFILDGWKNALSI